MITGGNGKFITFEGGEGTGKTTQVKLLAQRLSDMGLRVQVTREPGGDEIGENIRRVIKFTYGYEIDPLCEALLMFAARRDHLVKLVWPLLKSGYFVICDRFFDSTIVYQGLLKKVAFEDIMHLKRIVMGDFEPDLTIILDVSPETSINRVRKRGLVPDEYDMMNVEKHNIIRMGFRQIADIFSFRSVLINAEKSEEIVCVNIIKAVQERICAEANNPNDDSLVNDNT